MPPPGNKFLQLLDQGLSAFIFEKDEQDKPILSDNPLMVAPWRDELEEFIESTEPTLHSLITCEILMDVLSHDEAKVILFKDALKVKLLKFVQL